MKMKIHDIKIGILFAVLLGFHLNLCAQGSGNLRVDSKVTNAEGDPIFNAKIVLGNGLVTTYTDKEGTFSLEAKTGNIMMISALGYKELVIDLSMATPPKEIVLENANLYDTKAYELALPAGLTTTKRSFAGATDQVRGEELESYPDIVFSNSLQGRLSGLTARMTTNGLGNNSAQLFVRGLSREGSNGAITIVDGVERPIDFLYAQEIESVEVLKDAASKILYGPRAANGVILITTKRGKANTKVFRASVEYGVALNTRMAEYLNSAQYATLYNEARANDGLTPFYSQDQIIGYRNSTGENDQLYPNADYNDYFVADANPFRKAYLEYTGGSEGAKYALLAGYTGTQGIEKVGPAAKQDRINIRGNLDIDLSPSLVAHLGANGIIESRSWGKLNQDQFFSKIRNERPNEFPFEIKDPNFLAEDTPLGEMLIPPLGGSFIRPNSLYGDMVYGGFQEHQFFYGQVNFGLDLNLDQVLEGLSVRTDLSFDNYQLHEADQINNPIRYAMQTITGSNGQDSTAYVKLNNRQISTNRSESRDNIERNLGWTSNIRYQPKINDRNDLSLTLSHFYYINDRKGSRQKDENTNTFLRTAYSYKDRVYVEWTQAVMGSNRFAKGNRYEYFSTLSAGWVLSEENFMKDIRHLDYLKLKSSFGRVGYDRATSYYLYDTRYSDNGNVKFGERNQTTGIGRTSFTNLGNPNLKWETSQEFNVGVEGLAFQKSLHFEFNYFNELREDIIYSNPSAIYSDLNGAINMPQNMGRVTNNGVDGKITYYGRSGDFRYDVGANFLYVKNEIDRANTIDNPNRYFNRMGNPSDAIFGYVSKGLFKNQQEVDEAPFQALGTYGVGSVRYEDLNKDGVITEQDQRIIGNSFPRTSLGVNANFHYKGFGLHVLGTSELGVNFMKNNSYYRNSGEGKYSVIALDRFHPVNNPNGSQPALTTYYPANDFRDSSFWIEDASFFRLKNVEFSYTLSNDTHIAKMVRFHLRGTNLFVLSSVEDLDPEVPNSGVYNYPLFRTITGGVTVGF